MQKLQILFPEPDLRRLRRIAAVEDRPVSEIVRRATEAWLDRCSEERTANRSVSIPTFGGGDVLSRVDKLRELAWCDRCAEEG